MAKVFTFRMISGEEDGFVRDFEVRGDQTLLQLHEAIRGNLGYDPGLMSSFFTTDESWSKGIEIPLINMTGEEGARTMENTRVEELVTRKGDKLLYVFDYLANRGFFMEVVEVIDPASGQEYPFCSRAAGDPPPQMLLDDLAGDDLSSENEDLFPGDEDDLLSDGFENLDDLPEM